MIVHRLPREARRDQTVVRTLPGEIPTAPIAGGITDLEARSLLAGEGEAPSLTEAQGAGRKGERKR